MTALHKDAAIAVIGAGAMGAGIAQVAAQAGHPVRPVRHPRRRRRPGHRRHRQAARQARRGRQAGRRRARRRARPPELRPPAWRIWTAAPWWSRPSSRTCEVKREPVREAGSHLWRRLHPRQQHLLDVGHLAGRHSEASGALAGLHFFNPAPVMALVEIVAGLATDTAVADSLFATANAWGKKPVHAKSHAGLHRQPRRPAVLRREPAPAAGRRWPIAPRIDALLREAGGFPHGCLRADGHDRPRRQLRGDQVGVRRLLQRLPLPALADPEGTGRRRPLGRKSGRGFYDYAEGAEKPGSRRACPPAAKPACVVVEGDLGPASALIERVEARGHRDRPPRRRRPDPCRPRRCSALSDGRMATQRARD